MPIRISSAINGFRRAGVAHPSKPTVYPDGFFSDDQIKQLKAEPRLAVEFGDFETADPAGQGADQEGALEPDSISDGVTDSDLDDAVEQDDAPQTPDESNDQVDRDDAVESDSTPAAVTEGHIDGVVEPDGTQKSLEEMDSDLDDAVEQDDAPQTPDESNDQVDRDDAVESDSTPAAVTEGHIDGVVEPDGTQKSLEEMDEEDVRQLGKDLGIRSYHNMGLDKLIEKIRAEKVQVPAEGEV